MKPIIDFDSSIHVDENQLVNLKIEIKCLPEDLIEEYFLEPHSELQKYFSKVLISCLKNIGASEIINNEGIEFK